MRQQTFVILGGGTAGWMAANLLQHHWGHKGVQVQVIDTTQVGTIGVGEGSTPQLGQFFRRLGIADADWMPRCHASYKLGISFLDWSRQPGFERYFHPFPGDLDDRSRPSYYFNSYLRRRGADVEAHPDAFFLAAELARQRKAPLPDYNFPFRQSYGYHFDSALLGEFLREHARGLGVRHRDLKITGVKLTPEGQVAGLQGEGDTFVEGDFFIDASGFSSLILQDALGVPFVSYAENLFNDRAVALPSFPDAKEAMEAQTLSVAMNYGWRWAIPLTHRQGNGYVYSSAYCSADQAETELRAALGLLDSEVEARHLRMKVGRVAEPWHRNCLAVGLAQGFIEPLEATALHLVQATVEGFIQAFDSDDDRDSARQAFNRDINARFDGVRDYIVAHYRMSRRNDNDYWRDNTGHDHLSDSLKAVLECWFGGADLKQEIKRQGIGNYYSTSSWHCLLGGLGHFPQARHPVETLSPQRIDMSELDDFFSRCALNFPNHRDALASLAQT